MRFAYMADTHFGVYDQQAPTAQAAAAAVEQVIEEAVLAEDLGFDGVFLPERHARGETFVPSPLLAAAAIAARTSRIRIATTVLLPTLYNPMHLAEQVAMIDNLSRGRFTLGVGVGYHQDYHRFFGVPWEQRGKRFEEVMAVLRLAFAGDRFSFNGQFYQFSDVQLTPRTYQRPSVPVWIGTHSRGKPLDRAIAADGWVLWTQPDWDESERWIAQTRQRAAATGRGQWDVVLNQDGWIGDHPTETRARHAHAGCGSKLTTSMILMQPSRLMETPARPTRRSARYAISRVGNGISGHRGAGSNESRKSNGGSLRTG
ncbi:MAG: LLM class flavin-dependent oxidoreductase [Caenibius sp.]